MKNQYKPSVSTTSYVYAGSRLISSETGSGTTYVTVDHLGSTRVTTDGSGNVTSRKDFMSFGEEAITAERGVGARTLLSASPVAPARIGLTRTFVA